MARRRRLGLGIWRRTPPGTPPGTVVVDPTALPPVLRIIAYGRETFHEIGESSPKAIPALLKAHEIVWANVDGLGGGEMIQELGEIFGLHRLALEDVVNVHQRSKVESHEDHYFIVARMPGKTNHFETEQLSIFLGRNFVVTFQERPGDCLDPVRDRLRQGRPRFRSGGPDYLAYAILDAVADAYFPVLDAYAERLEGLEVEIQEDPGRDAVPRLHALKQDLLLLRRVLWPLRETLGSLLREETPLIADATRIYIRDCHDHTVQLMELTETYRDFSSGLMDLYLSLVSNRVNEVMKVLTIIATIFIPLSFVAGVYGMNFNSERSPWNMPELNWYWGYPFALLLMAGIVFGMIVYFWRKGWFR